MPGTASGGLIEPDGMSPVCWLRRLRSPMLPDAALPWEFCVKLTQKKLSEFHESGLQAVNPTIVGFSACLMDRLLSLCRVRSLHQIILGLAVSTAVAVDGYQTTPMQVYTFPYSDGRTRITVDWGTQGETIRRNPVECREQHEGLVRWVKSAEFKAIVERGAEKVADESIAIGTKAAVDLRYRQEHEEQAAGLLRSALPTQRLVSVPTWVQGIPWDLRRILVVGAFDARDADQVRWALSLRTQRPDAQLFAVGWRSQSALEALMKEHPSLKAGCVVSVPGGRSAADWCADYGITSLPAAVEFPDLDHLRLTEGVAP